MNDELKKALQAEIKNNPQTATWHFFDLLLEHYKARYKHPIKLMKSDIDNNFIVWNPSKLSCNQCGMTSVDLPYGFAGYPDNKFCSYGCSQDWLAKR